MPLKNTETEYGSVSKTFHWITAILIIAILILGHTMDDVANGSLRGTLYMLHKSLGIMVLALTFLRMLWHLISKKPKAIPELSPMEKSLSKALHWLFYILLLIVPLSGWYMSSAAGHQINFFKIIKLPLIISKDRELSEIMEHLHKFSSSIIMYALALHALSALDHHILKKDNVLKRMLLRS